MNGDRGEAGVAIGLSQFTLHGRVYVTREDPTDAVERVNRGFIWGISRRFGGFLPIRAPGRRGTVR